MFIESGKLSQLAEDVALKITLFRCLHNLQIGIMKLKMINLPIFHSLLPWVCVVMFPFIPHA